MSLDDLYAISRESNFDESPFEKATHNAPNTKVDSTMTPCDTTPTVAPTDNDIAQITYHPDDKTPQQDTSANTSKLGPNPNFHETRGGSTEEDNTTPALDNDSTDDESTIIEGTRSGPYKLRPNPNPNY